MRRTVCNRCRIRAWARANVLGRARDGCAARNVDLALWLVGLHNSTLGEQHPDLCMRSCFGDVYTYSLCPSQSAVRDYLHGITDDVCGQFQPQRLILEAVGFLGMRHGVHHELFMTGWSESLELLLSLCFCGECTRLAEREGVAVERLRQRVADVAERLLNEERETALESGAGEAASLLMEIPDLARYVQCSAQRVIDAVALVRATAQSHHVELETIPSSFHRPVTRAWIEHAPLAGLSQVSDGLVILTYFDNERQVAADLSWAATLAPQARLVAGLLACAPTLPSQAVLLEQVRAIRAANCSAVYVYNYGMLTASRLDWVREAFTAGT